MKDWSELTVDSLSPSPRFSDGSEHPLTTHELSLDERAHPTFLQAISMFSDTVSQTAEPFAKKLKRLLELSVEYLQAKSAAHVVLEGLQVRVVSFAGDSLEVCGPLDRRIPVLETCLKGMEPVDLTASCNDTKSCALFAGRFIGSPIRIDGRLAGAVLFVGVAAAESARAQEQMLFVKMIARYIGNEASRERFRSALTYRIEFEKLLNDISLGLITIQRERIDQAIQDALRRVAEFAGVDMSYLLLFRDQQTRIGVTHWWMADDRVPDFQLEDIPVSKFSWSLNRVLNREVVVMPEHHQMPLEADAERRFIKSQGIKTAILTPVVHRGQVLGVVGFASMRQSIVIDRDTIQLLEMVGHTLASAVELKQAQERVVVLETQMRHAQKLESLGVLAGGIAHDFNNLLMGILGNAGIALQDPALTSETRTSIERVERIARHAGDLTNQLLAYSGRGKFVVESVNLSDIVSRMLELLSTVVSKKHKLRTNFATDLPVIEVDIAQLSQVVMNLITNASEAIGDRSGEITLSTGLLAISNDSLYESYYSNNTPDGVYVYLRVTDSGCGMDTETQSRIFDPFYSTKFTGRGLGLAAVLGIVRSHGGTIRVDSQQGQGTTFAVLLPCAKQQELVTVASAAIVTQQVESCTSVLKGKCILIVDDEESIRTVLQSVLSRLGVEVRVAANGNEALQIFAEVGEQIDACVVDMTMPDISGYEVCEQIRQSSRSVPILLTSGYSECEVRKHCVTLGETFFIQKPFHPNQLTDQLSEFFR